MSYSNSLLMPRNHQIHEQPDRPGHSGGKLTKERIPGINVDTFAIVGHQQAAVLRLFAWIMTREQWLELWVPLRHEIETSLLHPTIKIFGTNFVWIRKDALIRRQDFYRCFFHRNARIAVGFWVRR